MQYDFTSLMDRHGKDAIAVDGVGGPGAPGAPKAGFDVIPMWVADMNFPTCPTIQQAIIARAQHPAFGYFDPTPEYYDSIIRWQGTRNGALVVAIILGWRLSSYISHQFIYWGPDPIKAFWGIY